MPEAPFLTVKEMVSEIRTDMKRAISFIDVMTEARVVERVTHLEREHDVMAGKMVVATAIISLAIGIATSVVATIIVSFVASKN